MQADKRALLLAVTAMLCGLVLGHLYLTHLEARVTGGALVGIVISTQDAQPGTTLSEAVLGTRDVPQAYVESRHIRARDLTKLAGTRLQAAVRANEALLWGDIAGMTSQPRSLSSLIRPGLRAFSVRSESGALAAMLRPGDRVDVLRVAARSADATTHAKPLLEGLLVLAVDGQTSTNAGITLAVTTAQGLTLSAAEQEGSLRLLLRNPEELVDATRARHP